MYLRGDAVLREGEVSREMYFIKSGAVQARLIWHYTMPMLLLSRAHRSHPAFMNSD